MAKSGKKKQSKKARAAQAERAADRSRRRFERRLARRLDALHAEQRALNRRLKKLAKTLKGGPSGFVGPSLPVPPPFAFRGRFKAGPGPKGRGGFPPWGRELGPVVSLEVPLENDDPAAPLWATVSARLPEEITAVGDDGRIVRYRYSAVGSTPQAPRYRHVQEPAPGPPEGFPG